MRKSRGRQSPFPRPALTASAIALLVAVFGFLYFKGRIENWLRGEDFRRLVSKKTSELLGMDAQFDRIRWEGSGAYSDRFTGRGIRPGAPEGLTALRIRSDFNWRRMFSGFWSLGEIRIGYLEAAFPIPGVVPARAPDVPASEPAPVSAQSPQPFFLAWLPTRFETGPVIVEKADLSAGEATLSSTTIESRAEGGGWVLDFRGGALSAPGLPDFTLTSARVRIAGDGVYLVDSSALTQPSGRLEAAGFFKTEQGAMSRMDIKWDSIDAGEILPKDWRAYLTGVLAGSATIRFSPGDRESTTIAGSAAVRDGTLQGFGILETLSTFSGSPRFLRLPLHELSADFSIIRGATDVRNLVIESKGLVRVEGALDIAADQSIAGALEVGLSPQTLQWLPGSRNRVFITSRDGYLWTTVRIGGTLQNPTEDLSPRLVVAAGRELIETGTRIIENPVDAAKEGIQKTIDLLPGVFP